MHQNATSVAKQLFSAPAGLRSVSLPSWARNFILKNKWQGFGEVQNHRLRVDFWVNILYPQAPDPLVMSKYHPNFPWCDLNGFNWCIFLMYRRILDRMLPCLRAWRSIVTFTWIVNLPAREQTQKGIHWKGIIKNPKTIDVTYGLSIICHNVNQCDQLINMSHRSLFWHLFQSWVARFLHLFSFLEQAPGFPGISENLQSSNQRAEEEGTISPLLGAFHKSFLKGFDGCVYPPSTSPAQMSQTHGLPELFQAEIRCNTGEM